MTFLPHVLCVERFEARAFRTTSTSRCQISNIPTRTPKKKHNVYGLGILSNYLYIQFGWKSCEKLIQHQPIHHKIVSSRSDWTLYVFLHISHENDSNFSKDGNSLPALPDERFHFTKAGKHPEKTITLGVCWRNFPSNNWHIFLEFPMCWSKPVVFSSKSLPIVLPSIGKDFKKLQLHSCVRTS